MSKVKSSVPWKYNLIIEGEFDPIIVKLGDSPDWIDKHKEQLEGASRISLVSKEGMEMPFVTVALDEDKRWIFFSRVHGTISGGSGIEIRLYCIGWQTTVQGTNVKSLTWIYPNGVTENGPAPMFTHHYLQ